jgi:hypothetical protein
MHLTVTSKNKMMLEESLDSTGNHYQECVLTTVGNFMEGSAGFKL